MASNEFDLSAARWRKSSYSNGSGGECVEIAEAFPGAAHWTKSTYSNGDGGNCVEVAQGHSALVPVRDSKTARSGGPVLLFRTPAWAAFVSDLKR
ncbi:DUF397 domain-containing protein [Streptomyces sp. NBC_01474]|uniref:DUF397 domain-containing protein n=1 Tax=unclassified Streptomyces TaxID=2593676 RepID=UPI002DDAAE91|nr:MULTISPECIES: DUF397 domain-containing protein [unclassified Streptomyces]WSD97672.1 DUF397 domain-containing protein [Streptomyces sp. NBC_01474]